MVEIRFEVDTPLSPQQVRAAATDFSERRPEIWSGIDPNCFTVHALGDTTAEVTEGGREFGGSGLESAMTGPTRTWWSPGCWTPTSSVPAAGGSCGSDLGPRVAAGWSGPRSASRAASKAASWSWSSGSPAGRSCVAICTRPWPSWSTRPREQTARWLEAMTARLDPTGSPPEPHRPGGLISRSIRPGLWS